MQQVAKSMPNISAPSLHPIQMKQPPQLQPPLQLQQPQQQPQQQKFYQAHGNQILSPSSTSAPTTFVPVTVTTPPSQSTAPIPTTPQLQPISQATTCTQQSAQCQTDPPDIKPNIAQLPSLVSPIKQELPSPVSVQVPCSPAPRVASPRVAGKSQTSPVTIAVSPAPKPIVSPVGSVPPMPSPRQGVKRPATSPIRRQINRSDL